MREMFSDMPFMYGMVAVVVGVAVSFVSVVVVGRLSKDCPNCRAKAQLKSAVPVKDLAFSCQDPQGSCIFLPKSSKIWHFLARIFNDLAFSCQDLQGSFIFLSRSLRLWCGSSRISKKSCQEFQTSFKDIGDEQRSKNENSKESCAYFINQCSDVKVNLIKKVVTVRITQKRSLTTLIILTVSSIRAADEHSAELAAAPFQTGET
ncbi:hypothetical protein AWC38_SpisGene24563 [Stylophora pistillata]|uniref:Transmembrane protein n=1 Tax=Stylophora pistillata TaxID=50429 RepID=A0A2B4R3A1_STYPI|nr:hypothetical protein AWC38_SpisGene24563 [Stylophora pistillata]